MAEITLQHVIFPDEAICAEEPLYYRKGIPFFSATFNNGSALNNGQTISFDTYFNAFSLKKWTAYTQIENVSLRITLQGEFCVKLLQMCLKNDEATYQQLALHTISAPQKQTFVLPFVAPANEGMLAFSLQSLKDGAVFYDADYITEANAPASVKIAVCICTFKREKYVQNNLAVIKNRLLCDEMSGSLEVIVADNAGTLDEKMFDDARLHLFKNKNTGGSGGFTRCIIEADNMNACGAGFTHVLLMDDDVIVEPEAIFRTHKMLSLLKPQFKDAFVGGAMLTMKNRAMQAVSGERWHFELPGSHVESFNKDLDLSCAENVLLNEQFTKCDYQAWWFCAMPTSFANKNNLPYPLFIKHDDIEYSKRYNGTFILLNGIAVWHESFSSKYSAPNEYYAIRNFLIAASALDAGFYLDDMLVYLKMTLRRLLSNYKYLELQYVCRAINDFLRGVDYFKETDPEQFHKTQLTKGYKMLDADKLPVKIDRERFLRDGDAFCPWSKRKKRFAKYTGNGIILPARGHAVLGVYGGAYEQTYRKKFLVMFEPETNKGFVVERSFFAFVKGLFAYRKTRRALKRKFDKTKQEFFERKKELTCIENWNKILEI